MPRGPKPAVRYWKSWGGYGAHVKGEQHLLAKGPDDGPNGPTFVAAQRQFTKLLELEAGKGTDDYLVSALLNQYRAHLRTTRKSSDPKKKSAVPGIFEAMARGFSETFGSKKVCELQPFEFDKWLQTQWNPMTPSTNIIDIARSVVSLEMSHGTTTKALASALLEREEVIEDMAIEQYEDWLEMAALQEKLRIVEEAAEDERAACAAAVWKWGETEEKLRIAEETMERCYERTRKSGIVFARAVPGKV